MAVVTGSILGKVRKSVGNVTLKDWKGINVMSSKVTTVFNPRTPAQTAQRGKFAALNAIGRRMLASISLGFRNKAIGMSEANYFQKINKAAVSWSGSAATVDLAALQVSSGSVGAPGAATVANGGTTGSLAITIANNTDGSVALATDKLYIAVWNATENSSILVDTGKTRVTAATSFQVNTGATSESDTVHLYFFFKRATSSETSDNTYATTTV